jgi:hypothetical protein
VPTVITNESGGVIVTNLPGSTLGVLWHAIEPRPTSQDLQGVCFAAGKYVVTGDGGTILTSADGTNWTTHSTPTTKLLTGASAWTGGVVACGDDGALLTSPNGTQWTLRDSKTDRWLYRVRFLNGVLVAVGEDGTLLTSTDGVAWTARTTGTTAWLNDASFIDDTYFVVGTQGTVLTSSNLSQWTDRGTVTRKALYAAATDGARLVVGGIEGIILRSPVIPDLTPVQFLSYARLGTNGVQNLYLFGGKPDQRFTLDRTEDLDQLPWQTGPLLEFFNGEGTLFYIESIAPSKAPPAEFYGGRLEP